MCDREPCFNGGSCRPLSSTDFECTCPYPYLSADDCFTCKYLRWNYRANRPFGMKDSLNRVIQKITLFHLQVSLKIKPASVIIDFLKSKVLYYFSSDLSKKSLFICSKLINQVYFNHLNLDRSIENKQANSMFKISRKLLITLIEIISFRRHSQSQINATKTFN